MPNMPESVQWTDSLRLPDTESGKPHIGVAGAILGISNQQLLIAGGANFPDALPWEGGAKKSHDIGYIYSTDTMGAVAFSGRTFKLPEAVAYSAVATTPVGIAYAGGDTIGGFTDKARLLVFDTVSKQVNVTALPDLPTPIAFASMAFFNNELWLAGGETDAGASDKVYSLPLNNPRQGWAAQTALPQKTALGVLLAQNDKNGKPTLFLTGGRCKQANGISTIYNNVWRLDNDQWVACAALPAPIAAHSGVAVGNAGLLLCSGDKAEVFTQVETLLAQIAVETNDDKKAALTIEKNRLQQTHPGFTKEVLRYNAHTDTWKILGNIPYMAPVTCNAVLWNNEVFIGSGEIRAGVRTPVILVGKLGF